jgi:serine/threonine-protein kinase
MSETPFGPFVLIDKLAQGGMATTWLARVNGDDVGRELVIKRILPQVAGDADVRAFFAEEARTAMLLDHENLVRTWDYGEVDSEHYIAMEYIWGMDLRRIVDRGASLKQFIPLRLVVDIVMRIARGLYVAHNLTDARGKLVGLVHRDISPPNIMVGFDGRVKLVDFGIAKAESHYMKVRPGQLKGKFSYMAPEQVQGLEIDARSDIFALGIVLYELTTRKRLFKADNDMATIRMVSDARFDPPHRVKADYPPRLEEIVLKALARDPADRYKDAWEMAQALENYLKETRSEPTQAQLASYVREIFVDEIERLEEVVATGWAGPTGPPRLPQKPRAAAPPPPVADEKAAKRPMQPSGPALIVEHQVGDDVFQRESRLSQVFFLATGLLVAAVLGIGIWVAMTRGTTLPVIATFDIAPNFDDLDVGPVELAPPPPTVTAQVTSEPAGAWVVVNGVATRQRTPTSVELVEGQLNTVAFFLHGYESHFESVDTASGVPPMNPTLTAITQPTDWLPTPATETTPAITEWTLPMSTVRVETFTAAGPLEGAEVLLNGEPVPGTTPIEIPVPAGIEQHLTVRMADYRDTVTYTFAPTGAARDLRLELTPYRGGTEDRLTRLDITTTPREGATIRLNGESTDGETLRNIENPLHYVVHIQAPDHRDWMRAFSATVGYVRINAVLPQIQTGPAMLTMHVEPVGTVIFAERLRTGSSGANELGTTDVATQELPSGEYQFTLDHRADGVRQRARFTRTLEAGQSYNLSYVLDGENATVVTEEITPMEGVEAGGEIR